MPTNPGSTLRKLLRWYDRHGRTLPWRNTRDAYKILLSEIMLQQTQVSRVMEFYQRWLRLFPNWAALAKAGNAEVIRAWSGLGYNRRALHLRDIARHIVAQGEPKSREEWLELKGVGEYTAAAVAIFARGEAVLPVDTNVRRVLGRMSLGRPFPQPSQDATIKRLVEPALARMKRCADVPQALFDFANLVCIKSPDCVACPLRKDCQAARKFLSGKVRVPRHSIRKGRERIRLGKPHPDRIYRGRILRLVQAAPRGVGLQGLGPKVDETYAAHRDAAWLRALISRLQDDGLLAAKSLQSGHLSLP